MENKILCIKKLPFEDPYSDHIENTLEAMQKFVGGYIETYTFAADAAIICNEEGRLLGMPYNCTVCGMDFVGPILIVGVNGEEFCSLPDIKFKIMEDNKYE